MAEAGNRDAGEEIDIDVAVGIGERGAFAMNRSRSRPATKRAGVPVRRIVCSCSKISRDLGPGIAVVTDGSFPCEFVIDDGFTDPCVRIRERNAYDDGMRDGWLASDPVDA